MTLKVSAGAGAAGRRASWRFVGGEPALDFANTAEWHASGAPRETLASFADLVRWCRSAGLLARGPAAELLREAARHPAAAGKALRRAVEVREALYRLTLAVGRGAPPDTMDLAVFNRALGSALRHARLAAGKRGLSWIWGNGRRPLEACLWPVLDSAAELLTSERRSRIRQCADDRGCGWVFLDTTKNRSRRWCDMADCGNRAKARRFARGRRRPTRGDGAAARASPRRKERRDHERDRRRERSPNG